MHRILFLRNVPEYRKGRLKSAHDMNEKVVHMYKTKGIVTDVTSASDIKYLSTFIRSRRRGQGLPISSIE